MRFLARNRMLNGRYARLYVALSVAPDPHPARAGAGRPTGPVFFGKDLELEIGKRGTIRFGRFVWIGDGTKIRCHEGEVEIGAKTVIGQECTISAYRRVRIGEQCVIADRAMFIDFDHGVVEVERPIRLQGIYMRDVEVGSNVWVGYGACVLRGCRVGDNAILGTSTVVTRDIPANAVVAGVPARIMRMRDAPPSCAGPSPSSPTPTPGPRFSRSGAEIRLRFLAPYTNMCSCRVRRRFFMPMPTLSLPLSNSATTHACAAGRRSSGLESSWPRAMKLAPSASTAQ